MPHPRITIDPKLCHGKPVVAGTRTPVAVILGHLAGGDSMETVCREYDLTIEDVRAALAFASEEIASTTFADTQPLATSAA